MKAKKILAAVLCAVMMLSLAVPAFAAGNSVKFKDVDKHWAKDAIYLVANAGIVGGYPDGRFGPNDGITRAQFSKVIANFMGFKEEGDISAFTDLNPNDNLTPYVAKCVKAGVLGGTSATTMSPNAKVTRETAATMLSRAFKLDTTGYTPDFTDKNAISGWAKAHVAVMKETGLIAGYPDGSFNPKKSMTRAEMMTIIARLLPDYDEKLFSITGTAGNAKVSFDMLDDYSSLFDIPKASADVSSVKVSVVPGPQLAGVGTIEREIPTGQEGSFSPSELFSAAYDFTFASANITYNGKQFNYNIYGKDSENGRLITGTPADSKKVDAAMSDINQLIDMFKQLGGNGGGSGSSGMMDVASITVKKGTYIQVGSEQLYLQSDLVIKNGADEQEITDAVKNAVVINPVKNPTDEFKLYVSGMSMRVMMGILPIDVPKKMVITVTANGTGADFDGILSTVSNATENDIDMLMGLVNEIIGAIDGHVITVNINSQISLI